MTERMQPLVLNAMRALAEELRLQPVSDSLGEIPASKLEIECALDARSADSVNSGTLIFPDTPSESDADWCVLSIQSVDRVRNVRRFQIRERLKASSSAEMFVEQAYRCILMRPVDIDGKRSYTALIGTHKLTRRNVLKILAESEEARMLCTRYLILPEPSPWLSIQEASDERDFPTLVVALNE